MSLIHSLTSSELHILLNTAPVSLRVRSCRLSASIERRLVFRPPKFIPNGYVRPTSNPVSCISRNDSSVGSFGIGCRDIAWLDKSTAAEVGVDIRHQRVAHKLADGYEVGWEDLGEEDGGRAGSHVDDITFSI